MKFDNGNVFDGYKSQKIREDYKVRLEISDHIEPIISKELFDKCQALKQAKTQQAKGKKTVGFKLGVSRFGGRITCENCGMTYIANRSNGRLFYNCKGKRQFGVEFCKSKNFKEEEFEKLFTDVRDEIYELQQGKLNKYIWNCLEVVRIDIEHQIDNDHSEEIKELNNIIQNRKSEIKRLLRITAKSNIDFDTYAEQLTEYQNEINESKKRLEELKPERLKEKNDWVYKCFWITSYAADYKPSVDDIISATEKAILRYDENGKPYLDITFNHLKIFPQFEEGIEEFLSPYPCTKIFTNITRIDTVKEFLENNRYEEMEDVEKINNMLKEKKV